MDALSAYGVEGACRRGRREEGDQRRQDHGLARKDEGPPLALQGRRGLLRQRCPDALLQAGRRRDGRERGEDRHGGDRKLHGFVQPVAQAFEAPVDDPEVEAERTTELRVAKPVAKLQVEEEVVVDRKRGGSPPDGFDDLLVTRDRVRVGETVGVDLCGATVVRGRSRLAGKLRGE